MKKFYCILFFAFIILNIYSNEKIDPNNVESIKFNFRVNWTGKKVRDGHIKYIEDKNKYFDIWSIQDNYLSLGVQMVDSVGPLYITHDYFGTRYFQQTNVHYLFSEILVNDVELKKLQNFSNSKEVNNYYKYSKGLIYSGMSIVFSGLALSLLLGAIGAIVFCYSTDYYAEKYNISSDRRKDYQNAGIGLLVSSASIFTISLSVGIPLWAVGANKKQPEYQITFKNIQ